MPDVYNEKGVRLRHPFPCPKCRHPHGPVVNTSQDEGGGTIRKRRCPDCAYSWVTFQEPEYLLPREAVRWGRHKLQLVNPDQTYLSNHKP
jgi:transposase-like protein